MLPSGGSVRVYTYVLPFVELHAVFVSPIPGYYVQHDVVNKTGSTYRIATPPEEDRATAMADMPKNL